MNSECPPSTRLKITIVESYQSYQSNSSTSQTCLSVTESRFADREKVSYLENLLQLAQLTLQLSVVLLQQSHPVLQPRPVLSQHGRLRQHLRLGGVHAVHHGHPTQCHVWRIDRHAGHLTPNYLEMIVLLLQIGILHLKLPNFEIANKTLSIISSNSSAYFIMNSSSLRCSASISRATCIGLSGIMLFKPPSSNFWQ